MKGQRTRRLTLGIAAGLFVLGLVATSQYPRFLAAHWRTRLATVSEDRAPVLLESVARLGEPGVPVLVEALGSKRPGVAAAAKRVLGEELQRWEMLRARDYSPKLAILARSLANRAGDFGPAARAEAAELASQVLRLWTLDQDVVDPLAVIADCEAVLRAAGPRRALAEAGDARQPLAAARREVETAGRRPSGDLGQGAARLPGDVAALPGGGLPVDTLASPDGPGEAVEADGSRTAGAEPHTPRRLERPSVARPLEHPLRPMLEPDAPGALAERAARRRERRRPAELPPTRPLGFLDEAPVPAGDRRGDGPALGRLAELETVELMRRLPPSPSGAASPVEAELVRRGFTETHLALARRLFDPDPQARRRLARLVVELPDVNAVPWLLQLARDEHAEVRLSAISLLATTGDPSLVEAIEAMAREDPEPRVQRQAEQIARRRREGRY